MAQQDIVEADRTNVLIFSLYTLCHYSNFPKLPNTTFIGWIIHTGSKGWMLWFSSYL